MALSKKDRRKRNYALLMNAFNNVELARRGRDWSDKRLDKELALKVPKKKADKIPAIKKPTRSQAYYDRKLENTIYAIEIGHTSEDVRKLRDYKKTKIETSLEFRRIEAKKDKTSRIQAKIDKWTTWAKNDALPPFLQRKARKVNKELLKKKLEADAKGEPILNYNPEPTDHYGYATTFYHYTKEIDLDEAEELVQYDFYDRYRLLYEGTIRVI